MSSTFFRVKVKVHFPHPLGSGASCHDDTLSRHWGRGRSRPYLSSQPRGRSEHGPREPFPEEKLSKCWLYKQHFAKWLPRDTHAVRCGVCAVPVPPPALWAAHTRKDSEDVPHGNLWTLQAPMHCPGRPFLARTPINILCPTEEAGKQLCTAEWAEISAGRELQIKRQRASPPACCAPRCRRTRRAGVLPRAQPGCSLPVTLAQPVTLSEPPLKT